jgi:type VI secretion system secreted protein VgrG
MVTERYTEASSSVSSRPEMKRRKEVLIKADEPKRYSQRVNFAGVIGIDPTTDELHARVPYEAYDNDGQILGRGVLDSQGTTNHIFSNKPGKATIVLGLGSAGWSKFVDAEHGTPESE